LTASQKEFMVLNSSQPMTGSQELFSLAPLKKIGHSPKVTG